MNHEERKSLEELLKMNLDIFAWRIDQISGIERSLIEHKLCIKAKLHQLNKSFDPSDLREGKRQE